MKKTEDELRGERNLLKDKLWTNINVAERGYIFSTIAKINGELDRRRLEGI